MAFNEAIGQACMANVEASSVPLLVRVPSIESIRRELVGPSPEDATMLVGDRVAGLARGCVRNPLPNPLSQNVICPPTDAV